MRLQKKENSFKIFKSHILIVTRMSYGPGWSRQFYYYLLLHFTIFQIVSYGMTHTI